MFVTQHHNTDPESFMCKRWQQQMLKGSEEWKLISDIEVLLIVVGGDHSHITLRGLRRLDGMKSWIINKFV